MKKLPLAFVLLIACGGSGNVPCTQAEVAALRQLYERAASDVISSGACDKMQRVEQCPDYMLIETHFKLAAKGLCSGGGP